jgi:hypothetical protein
LYIYDPGDSRPKHKWKRTYAGFRSQDGKLIGKCPCTIGLPDATDLLNSGAPWFNPTINDGTPDRIYNVHDGVIYEAVPTERGKSYHGFPCRGRLPGNIMKALRAIAIAKGCAHGFEQWVKEHIKK